MRVHKSGATGRFPDGKLNEKDEGEIRTAIGVVDGNVVIDFGTPVTWMAMPPGQAIEIANALMKKTKEAKEEG